MADARMLEQMTSKDGFIAALDQSGGSTPGALLQYGVPETAYHGEKEMYAEVHAMRVRIMSSKAFTGAKVLGAILFEATMDGEAHGLPVPTYLWEKRGVIPFLKVDKGLAAEADGVQLMKPMPELDALLDTRRRKGRVRHQDALGHPPRQPGRRQSHCRPAVRGRPADRQARPDADHRAGSLDQGGRQGRVRGAAARRDPEAARRASGRRQGHAQADHSRPSQTSTCRLVKHPKVVRVVALSGGYSRTDACKLLAQNHGLIASFSRALAEGLTKSMTDDRVRRRARGLDRRDLRRLERQSGGLSEASRRPRESARAL